MAKVDRVRAIVAGILVARHLKTMDSPRDNSHANIQLPESYLGGFGGSGIVGPRGSANTKSFRIASQEMCVRATVTVSLTCLLAAFAFGQSSGSSYQPGSITAVKDHQGAADKPEKTASYDVSLKVGNAVYVVLYTPALGTDITKFAVGKGLLVSVGSNTITFNDSLGRTIEVSILSRETLPDAGPLSLSDYENLLLQLPARASDGNAEFYRRPASQGSDSRAGSWRVECDAG